MVEVNAAVLILLVEGLVGLLITLGLILFFAMRRKKRRNKAIAQLVAQIKKQSEVRIGETGSFLQDIYQLEGQELKKAVETIDKGEKQLFQVLINGYLTEDPELITSIDASVAELIEIYKDLKPKVEEIEINNKSEVEALQNQIKELQNTNDDLTEELRVTKATIGDMVSEFGNMFGGGSDHQLAKFEVVEKVGVKREIVEDDAKQA